MSSGARMPGGWRRIAGTLARLATARPDPDAAAAAMRRIAKRMNALHGDTPGRRPVVWNEETGRLERA